MSLQVAEATRIVVWGDNGRAHPAVHGRAHAEVVRRRAAGRQVRRLLLLPRERRAAVLRRDLHATQAL